MITWENYEEYIMMHADGELNPADEQALMTFINAHPELKSELALYEATRLVPDSSTVYDGKAQLLQPVPAKRVINMPVWGRYSVAACIAALIFLSLFKYRGNNNNTSEVAATQVALPGKATAASGIPLPPDTAGKGKVAATTTNNPAAVNDIMAPNQPGKLQHKPAATIAAVRKVRLQEQAAGTNDAMHAKAEEAVATLPVATTKKMTSTVSVIRPETLTIPAYTMTVDNEVTNKRTLLDKLPIDDIKKKQLGNIASAISETYNDLSQPRKDGDDKKFSIKVEKKRLVLSF